MLYIDVFILIDDQQLYIGLVTLMYTIMYERGNNVK